MKKLLEISRTITPNLLFPSLAVVLAMMFWTASTVLVHAQSSVISEQEAEAAAINKGGKGGDKSGKGNGPVGGKCDVCHNPHNYHTINIPCEQVDKFLSDHPGDFRGRCQATPVTNP